MKCLLYLNFHFNALCQMFHWVLYADKKAFVCQQCGLTRDQQQIKKIASEVAELSEKASTVLSSGSILICEHLLK